MPYNPDDLPSTRDLPPESRMKDVEAAARQPLREADSRLTTASQMQLEGPLHATASMPASSQGA
eukprot:7595618-Alexandrium_andersonii.AAC.1